MAGYRDAIIAADTAWVATASAGDFVQSAFISPKERDIKMCLVMNELARIISGVNDNWWKAPRNRISEKKLIKFGMSRFQKWVTFQANDTLQRFFTHKIWKIRKNDVSLRRTNK